MEDACHTTLDRRAMGDLCGLEHGFTIRGTRIVKSMPSVRRLRSTWVDGNRFFCALSSSERGAFRKGCLLGKHDSDEEPEMDVVVVLRVPTVILGDSAKQKWSTRDRMTEVALSHLSLFVVKTNHRMGYRETALHRVMVDYTEQA